METNIMPNNSLSNDQIVINNYVNYLADIRCKSMNDNGKKQFSL